MKASEIFGLQPETAQLLTILPEKIFEVSVRWRQSGLRDYFPLRLFDAAEWTNIKRAWSS
ncbi:MAG: hypothetical protein GY822_07880 [Deltaproteobacteria bacterium]|nr:hypothetical protein [Deltaproteobacteria bacterium]